MPKKRRNGGKNRAGRGKVHAVRCTNCGRCVPKDKAIKRFLVRNMVEAAAISDINAASVYTAGTYQIPKLYLRTTHCVSCACHSRMVGSRSVVKRRIRAPPVRARLGVKLIPPGKPQRGVKLSQRRLAVVTQWAMKTYVPPNTRA